MWRLDLCIDKHTTDSMLQAIDIFTNENYHFQSENIKNDDHLSNVLRTIILAGDREPLRFIHSDIHTYSTPIDGAKHGKQNVGTCHFMNYIRNFAEKESKLPSFSSNFQRLFPSAYLTTIDHIFKKFNKTKTKMKKSISHFFSSNQFPQRLLSIDETERKKMKKSGKMFFSKTKWKERMINR